MSQPMDHERCSELLGPFHRGELEKADAADIERHLATCPACSEEHAGLALLLGTPPEPLRADERARLHAAVAAEMGRARAELPSVSSMQERRQRPWARRGAAFLAAAAALVVVGLALTSLPGEREDADQSASGAAGESADEREGAAAPPGPAPVFGGGATADTLAAEPSEAEVQAESARSAPAPSAPYSESELRRLGRTGKPFVRFARAYAVADVGRLGRLYLEELADGAPDEKTAAAVRACASVVMEEGAVLPVYGELAEVDGKGSLLLGFVRSNASEGALDQYMLWAFAGADCEAITEFVSGNVRLR